MRYKYYSKHSQLKDALGYINASNQSEAELLASKIKQLRLEQFLELFKVELA